MFTVTLRKLYNTKILVTTAVVPHKCYKPGMRHERFQKIKKKGRLPLLNLVRNLVDGL